MENARVNKYAQLILSCTEEQYYENNHAGDVSNGSCATEEFANVGRLPTTTWI